MIASSFLVYLSKTRTKVEAISDWGSQRRKEKLKVDSEDTVWHFELSALRFQGRIHGRIMPVIFSSWNNKSIWIVPQRTTKWFPWIIKCPLKTTKFHMGMSKVSSFSFPQGSLLPLWLTPSGWWRPECNWKPGKASGEPTSSETFGL